MSAANKNVIWFEDLSRGDVGLVGGKNSSLGEMVQQLGRRASTCRLALPPRPTPSAPSSRPTISMR
jgi:hypothetical protein